MQNKTEHRAELLNMITQWQQSGMTQKAFCTTNNIAYHVFHYWYGVYRSNQNTTSTFLPVNVTTAVNHEQIIMTGLNGIRIQFSFTDRSINFIKQLLIS
jgi:hypothetical protein